MKFKVGHTYVCENNAVVTPILFGGRGKHRYAIYTVCANGREHVYTAHGTNATRKSVLIEGMGYLSPSSEVRFVNTDKRISAR